MLNKVMLIGHLGADPEVRSLNSGDKVANLRLATSERWRDKGSGEMKERTQWHQVVIFNETLTDLVGRYARKGSKLYVEGQLEHRKWQDQSGADRYSTEVVLRQFGGQIRLLDSAEKDGGAAGAGDRQDRDYGDRKASGYSRREPDASDPFNDEIPF